MGIISAAADTYYTYRFLKTLVTPWEETDAFKFGIIDKNGKTIKKATELTTSEQKAAYSYFHRLVFNIKRIIEMLPFGKSRLANFAAALFLIKEHLNLNEDQLRIVLDKALSDFGIDLDSIITENTKWFIIENDQLSPGTYTLNKNVVSPSTGEIVAREGTIIIADNKTAPIDFIFGTPIYEVKHVKTKTNIFVSPEDLIR